MKRNVSAGIIAESLHFLTLILVINLLNAQILVL